MGYRLEAIIAPEDSIIRFMDSHDPKRVVSLPQGFAMIPLDECTCKSIDGSFNVSYQSLLTSQWDGCAESTHKVLVELSDQSFALLLVIDCFGGPCDQRGIVYRNGHLIYNRYVGADNDQGMYLWNMKTGFSLLWAKLLSLPLGASEPNPNHVPSVAHESLELIGVQCEGGSFDAFDQMGLGQFRETEDWLTHGS